MLAPPLHPLFATQDLSPVLSSVQPHLLTLAKLKTPVHTVQNIFRCIRLKPTLSPGWLVADETWQITLLCLLYLHVELCNHLDQATHLVATTEHVIALKEGSRYTVCAGVFSLGELRVLSLSELRVLSLGELKPLRFVLIRAPR